MAEWFDCTIGDLCDTISDTYKGNDNKVVLVNTSDVLEGKVLNHTPVENMNLKGQFKKTFRKNDILFSEIRPANKRFAFVDFEDTSNYIASTKLMVLRSNDKVIPEFLFAILKSETVLTELQHLAETRSGTFPQITFSSELAPMKIKIPDKPTQRKIVSMLSSIEQKMESNIAINNNLMQVASSLFSKALEDNADTLIATPLGEIADVKGGKRLPKGVNLQSVPNSHPYIRVRNLTNTAIVHINDDFEYVDDDTQRGISRYIVATNDVLLSIVGTIGLVSIVHPSLDNANLTENCVKLTNLKGITPQYLFLYLRSSDGQHEIARSTVGAVQAKLPIKNIQAINVPVLTSTQGKNLCETLNPLFSNMESLVAEIYSLTRLKNTLLPKLLSGEIDVSEVEF